MDDETPHPIQIVLASKEHTFSLDEEALSQVLMKDEIKDRYVVVVSVAGAFRKGKSFILDFFLRYMEWKVISFACSHPFRRICVNGSASSFTYFVSRALRRFK